ncbi:DUF1616 domain-containing protein [Pelotomaculum propionicicum]|uniref:DUF1616 domain-containing protein n=1 Tax=Pelotomaculum propionicicum TaxID=258475 RepID=UPI003BA154F8
MGISVFLAILISLGAASPLRAVLALPFILFFPGYTLTTALLPGKKDMGGIERIVLSFGLSIAVVPLLGLILNHTPWGISLYPVLIIVLLFTSVMSMISLSRRKRLPHGERYTLSWRFSKPGWLEMPRNDRVLLVTLAGIIFIGLGTLGLTSANQRTGEIYTEFYVLGAAGKIGDYPGELKTNETKQVFLGVVNHEQRRVTYNVELRLDGSKKKDIGPIELEHGQTWEGNIGISAGKPKNKMMVEFLLTKDGESVPYRSIHLWVDVKP